MDVWIGAQPLAPNVVLIPQETQVVTPPVVGAGGAVGQVLWPGRAPPIDYERILREFQTTRDEVIAIVHPYGRIREEDELLLFLLGLL